MLESADKGLKATIVSVLPATGVFLGPECPRKHAYNECKELISTEKKQLYVEIMKLKNTIPKIKKAALLVQLPPQKNSLFIYIITPFL